MGIGIVTRLPGPEQPGRTRRFPTMTTCTHNRQGRGPGLYDEQLQRIQQEKKLFSGVTCPDSTLLGRRRQTPSTEKNGGER